MATKKERQRQLARDARERRLERQAARAQREKRWAVSTIVVIIVAGIGVGSAALAGAFSSKPASAAAKPKATPSVTASPTPTSAMVGGKCVYTANGTAARKVSLPPAKPNTTAHYTANIVTNRGTVKIGLDNAGAPCTVNSFISLADQKYFNNTSCLRLTTAPNGYYVLQCGDPSGTGEGGPGYEFYTENTKSLTSVKVSGQTLAEYPAGIVAMANSSTPDSNGSQFFLVYKNSDLPGTYTPFGTIASGLHIIQNVGKAGSTNSNATGDGAPKQKVQIERVTITKT